jgi:hypothetical protein
VNAIHPPYAANEIALLLCIVTAGIIAEGETPPTPETLVRDAGEIVLKILGEAERIADADRKAKTARARSESSTS